MKLSEKKKKFIWVFNQFAGHPESGWGERHYYFATHWIQQGYQVVIFSGAYNHMFRNLPQTKGIYTFEYIDQVKFCWVKVPKYNPKSLMRFWSMLVFAWRVFRYKAEYDAIPSTIIVSSMPIFPIWSALKQKQKWSEIKVIFEIRDIWPLSLMHLANITHKHPLVRFIGWFEKLGYQKSDYIVSLLPNAKSHVEHIAEHPVSYYVIPNGIDTSLVKSEPLENSFTDIIPKSKFIVGYAGTMALANALEFILEAAKQLMYYEDIHFVFVGEGYLKEKLKFQASNLPNVTFLPKVRKKQVQELLKYFNICYIGWHNLPLYEYGVSANKYFDYMLAGKPILDSNNLIKDPVELSGAGIIVKPELAEAIAEGVLIFYNMSLAEREAMGKKGKDYVQEFHDMRQLAHRYSELF